jgi:hypothetical protein
MEQNGTDLGEKGEKRENRFHCILCDYKCSVRFSYDRHLLTAKHIKQSQMEQNGTNGTKKEKKEKPVKKEKNTCGCGLVYYCRTSLWRHKKTCGEVNNVELVGQNYEKQDELINYLIKENQEFKSLILEIVKKDTITNNNVTQTNSNNKTFNLQFFLNETCKDAMNIMDFVDSLKIQLSDLENVGKLGFVDGIANIIVKNLQALDVNKRPVHCSDSKREVMYIKDEDKWEKENEEKNKMRKVIKHIAHKNSKMLPEFKTKYPDCIHSNSNKSDQYNKIIIESMGGFGDNHDETENKIIKKIAKEVVIDKQ